jgi:hypothetical protein
MKAQDIVWCGDVGGLEIHLHFAPGSGFLPAGLSTKGCMSAKPFSNHNILAIKGSSSESCVALLEATQRCHPLIERTERSSQDKWSAHLAGVTTISTLPSCRHEHAS